MLSACLTAVMRRILPSAPLIAMDAHAAGSGKTLLCETVGTALRKGGRQVRRVACNRNLAAQNHTASNAG